MKKLEINCANAVLIRDSEGLLETMEHVQLNAANVVLTAPIQSAILKKGGEINCANSKVIPEPRNPVLVSENITIDAMGGYADQFLICEKHLHITAQGAPQVQALEGALVMGTLHYDEQLSGEALSRITAERRKPYPHGATLVMGSVELTRNTVEQYGQNDIIVITGTLRALDQEAAQAARQKNLSFQCGTLLVGEEEAKLLTILACDKRQVIPAGYVLVEKPMDLLSMNASYGDRLFCTKGFTIQPKDAGHLGLFESIIVTATVRASTEALAELKRVVRADRIEVFEGELLEINGMQQMNHDMLSAANEAGIRYTAQINGALILDDDVTAEDARAFCAVNVNGAVFAPGAARAVIQAAGKVNGIVTGSISDVLKMVADVRQGGGKLPGQLAGMLSQYGLLESEEPNDNVSAINLANYVMI